MKMYLWRLRRNDWDYDEHDEVIVRHHSEAAARQFVENSGLMSAPLGEWINPALSRCEQIKEDGEPGIVMDSFCAG